MCWVHFNVLHYVRYCYILLCIICCTTLYCKHCTVLRCPCCAAQYFYPTLSFSIRSCPAPLHISYFPPPLFNPPLSSVLHSSTVFGPALLPLPLSSLHNYIPLLNHSIPSILLSRLPLPLPLHTTTVHNTRWW
jgi:hypothetical protein